MESRYQYVQRECPDNQDNDQAFLLGAGVVGIVALIQNATKNERHQQELQQIYWQGIRQGHGEMAKDGCCQGY